MLTDFILTRAQVDVVSDEIDAFFRGSSVPERDILRNRLLVEEVLASYIACGSERRISTLSFRFFGRYRYVLRVSGAELNPLKDVSSENVIFNSVLDYDGSRVSYRYRNGCNEIAVSAKKARKRNLASVMLAFLAVGVAAGVFSRFCTDGEVSGKLVGNVMIPLADAFVGLLRVTSVPLVFFSTLLGIVSFGNVAGFGKTLRKFLVSMYAASVVVVAVLSVLAFYFVGSGGESLGIFDFLPVYDLVLGFVPPDIVSPFMRFDVMQIMVMGAMLGFSFMAVGDRTLPVVKSVDTLNLSVITINGFLNRFIPVCVAIWTFSMIVSADGKIIVDCLVLMGMLLAVFALLTAYYLVRVCVKFRISPFRYMGKLFPTFVINASSGSFTVSYFENVSALLSLGVPPENCSMRIGIGGLFYKPAHCAFFFVSAMYMAAYYSLSVSPMYVVLAAILSVLLMVSIPNIPCGCIPVLSMFFAQLQLPPDASVPIVSVIGIMDFVMVAVDVFCMQSEVVLLSCKKARV